MAMSEVNRKLKEDLIRRGYSDQEIDRAMSSIESGRNPFYGKKLKEAPRGMFQQIGDVAQKGVDFIGNKVLAPAHNAIDNISDESIQRFVTQNLPAATAAIVGTLAGNPSIGATSTALADWVTSKIAPEAYKNPSTLEKVRNGVIKAIGATGAANQVYNLAKSSMQSNNQNPLSQAISNLDSQSSNNNPEHQQPIPTQSSGRFSGLIDWYNGQPPEIKSQVLSAIPGLSKVLGSGAGAIYNSFNSKPEQLQQIGHYPEDQQSLINQIRTGGMQDILDIAKRERDERDAPSWGQRYEQHRQQNPNTSKFQESLGSAIPVGLATGGLGFLPTLIGSLGSQYSPEISKYGQNAYNSVSNRLSRLF